MKYKRVNKPKKLRTKEGVYGGHTTSLHDAIPYMMDACKGKGGCAFDCRHFVYDTLDGVFPFPVTTRIDASSQVWLMIEYKE